jgi:hypothetical protein
MRCKHMLTGRSKINGADLSTSASSHRQIGPSPPAHTGLLAASQPPQQLHETGGCHRLGRLPWGLKSAWPVCQAWHPSHLTLFVGLRAPHFNPTAVRHTTYLRLRSPPYVARVAINGLGHDGRLAPLVHRDNSTSTFKTR